MTKAAAAMCVKGWRIRLHLLLFIFIVLGLELSPICTQKKEELEC